MPELKFAVQADFEKVIRLKQEINHLETELQKLGRNAAPDKVKELENRLASARGEFNRMVNAAAKAGKDVDQTSDMMANSLKKVGAAIAGAFAFDKVQQFVSQMVAVRTEFQKADVAIQTMLGSKEKADALMGKVRDYAKVSPLEFADITNATKMMIGFNIEAEKVPRFLSAIGDVSMGEQQNFQSLTLAFSQMSATGKLMGQDLLQMINAGFNPLQAIADKTGKSIATLKDEMSKGAISAEMVQQAFIDATSAGGKFYQMSEKSAQTIGGQISMLEDAMAAMYNELGTKSEGVIISSIQGVTKLIENYERIGKAIGSLVAAYGVYKAAVVTVTAVEKIRATGIMALTAWEQRLVISTMAHKVATEGLTKAQLLLNKAMLTNPYVAMAAAIAACGVALYNMKSATERANDIVGEYNAKQEEAERLERERTNQMQKNISVAADESAATGTRKKALHDLVSAYPSIFAKYKTEADMLRDILNIKEQIAASDGQRAATRTREETAKLQEEVKALQKEINARGKNKANEYNEAFAGISTTKLQDTLKANQKILAAAQEKQRKDAQKAAYGSLNAYGDKTITAQIKAREDALNRFKINPNLKRVYIGSGALGGSLTQKEIEDQLKLLQLEQNARKERSKGMRELAKEAEMAYRKALAEQEAFLNSGGKGLSDQQKRDKVDELAAKVKATKAEWEKFTNATNRKGGNATNNAADAERHAGELLASVIQSNTDNEIALRKDGHEKNLALIENDFNKRTAAIKKQGDELRELNKKSGIGGEDGALTAEQTAAMEEQTRLAQQERDAKTAEENERYAKELADRHAAELQSMRDYLKEYGTFQQQKLAIAEEYADKIQKAQNEGERLRLTAERDSAMAAVDARNMAGGIDWSATIKGMGSLMEGIASETLAKVREYMKTTDFKNLAPKDKEAYRNLEGQLSAAANEQSNPFNKATWEGMNAAVREFQNAVSAAKVASALHEDALKQLKKAEEELANATDENAKEMAQAKVNTANALADSTATNSTQANDAVTESQGKLAETSEQLDRGLNNITSSISKLGSGSLRGIFDGAVGLARALKGTSDASKKAGNAVSEVGSAMSSAGANIVGIIGAILSILDELGDDAGQFIKDILDKVAKVVEGIISSLPSLIMKVQEGVVNIVKGVINGIGGLFTGDWFRGDEREKVRKENDRLTKSNEILTTAINKLRDAIKESTPTDAKKAYQMAVANMRQQEANAQRVLANNAGMSDGSHSINNRLLNNSAIKEIGKMIDGREYKDLNDLLRSMSGSDWDTLLTNEKGLALWNNLSNAILNAEDDGNYQGLTSDINKFISEYAPSKFKELEESLYESITGMTSSAFSDMFIKDLATAEKGVDDFCDDLTQKLADSAKKAQLSALFTTDIKSLQSLWKSFLENDGMIDEDELREYNKKAHELAEKVDAKAEEIDKQLGIDDKYSNEANGTINSAKSMTEDTGNQLVGIITATHMASQQILANSQLQTPNILTMTTTLGQLAAGQNEMRNIADDTRDIMAQSFLELQQIRENTGAVVQPIIRMDKRLANIETTIKNL